MDCSLEARPYHRPFRRPLRTAHGEWSVREGFLVKVTTEKGTGYGEVAPIPSFGSETLEEAAAYLGECEARGLEASLAGAPPCCAFALSAALKMTERRERGAEERAWAVAGLLPAGEGALDALEEKWDRGFRVFKWKIGVLDGLRERRLFKAMCQQLRRRLSGRRELRGQLRLDANGGLEVTEAEAWLRAAADSGCVDYVEQPLPVGAEREMARLAAAFDVPVALDESLNGRMAGGWLAPDGWAGPLVVKPALMGRLWDLRERLLPVADRVVFSSVFETDVGLCNALALLDDLRGARAAVGFDTGDVFGDAFNTMHMGPLISLSGTSEARLSELWKRLRHSS